LDLILDFQAIMALYEHPSNNLTRPSNITGSMIKTPLTGVDATTAYNVSFAASQAILSTSILIPSNPGPTVIIRYQHGTITIATPIFAPKEFTVTYSMPNGPEETQTVKVEWEGGGWHFQADEVARCVRDGKLQSTYWGWDKSIMEMEIFDEVSIWWSSLLPFMQTQAL
jgi:hypothetical protein